MTAKQYLAQIRDCNMRIKSIGWQIESLEGVLEYQSPIYSDMPKSPTRNIHRLQDLIAAKADLEQEIKDLNSKLAAVFTTIRDMPDPVHSAILSGRYILGKEWHEICQEINVSEGRIYQIHRDALAEIEKTVANYSSL